MLRQLSLPYALILATSVATLFTVVAIFPPAGDSLVHLIAMECLSEQLWKGDLYPSWCFSTFNNVGSPLFLFSFPLPYYIAALFYPLRWLGLSFDAQFIAASASACLVACLIGWYWLREYFTPPLALFGTLLYLLIPYRFEVIVFRVAYQELWAMALMPLVALYTRRLLYGDKSSIAKLAIVFALMCLCHIKIAAVAGMLSGMYLLGMNYKKIPLVIGSFAFAILMTSFFLVPFHSYLPFVQGDELVTGSFKDNLPIQNGWPNRYMTLANLQIQPFQVMGLLFTVLAALAILSLLYLRRNRLPAHLRNEVAVWAFIFVLSLTMVFPISKPLWSILEWCGIGSFPWRMQELVALSAVFLSISAVAYVIPINQKSADGNAFCMLLLLLLFGLSSSKMRDPKNDAELATFVRVRALSGSNFLPIWNDYTNKETEISYDSLNQFYEKRIKEGENPDKIRTRELSGKASVVQWDFRGIVIDSDSPKGGDIILDHHYFPLWAGTTEEGSKVELSPQEHTGYMIVKVPAGKHTLRLTTSVFNHAGGLILASYIASALGWLAAGWFARKKTT